MKYLVTGGAGFIGSNMVDRLLSNGHNVRVLSNLSSGKQKFISMHFDNPNFFFIEGDLLDTDHVKMCMNGVDAVIHLAANPDVRSATENTKRDVDQGIIGTYNVLEAMRKEGVNKIAYSSTSTVYGEAVEMPTTENYGPLFPISLYAASKLGAEGLITAFCSSFDMQCWLFRFANIIGNNGTHGILVDFIEKLKTDPTQLEILGDGKQAKSYLLVEECIDAMLYTMDNINDRCSVHNIGCSDYINVTRIAELVAEELGLSDVKFNYTGGTKGWIGDVPKMLLSVEKLGKAGWSAKHNSEDAIRESIRILKADRWDQ